MDPPTSGARPSNTLRVQLPSIKNLVDTLPPPNAYRSPGSGAQPGWNHSFHPPIRPESPSNAQQQTNNGPPRNRLQTLPPALQTPPRRHADSPLTVTASPSVVFSSASSGTSDVSMGDRVGRSQHPSSSGAPIRTIQDPRPNSPNPTESSVSSVLQNGDRFLIYFTCRERTVPFVHPILSCLRFRQCNSTKTKHSIPLRILCCHTLNLVSNLDCHCIHPVARPIQCQCLPPPQQ